jgi:hypothetical protein
VSWADKSQRTWNTLWVAYLFGEPPKDDPDDMVRGSGQVCLELSIMVCWKRMKGKILFFSVRGSHPCSRGIAIRFWHPSGTVAEMVYSVFDSTSTILPSSRFRPTRDPPYLSCFAYSYLSPTQGKADKIIPPNHFWRRLECADILMDLPYPQTLLAAAVASHSC